MVAASTTNASRSVAVLAAEWVAGGSWVVGGGWWALGGFSRLDKSYAWFAK